MKYLPAGAQRRMPLDIEPEDFGLNADALTEQQRRVVEAQMRVLHPKPCTPGVVSVAVARPGAL